MPDRRSQANGTGSGFRQAAGRLGRRLRRFCWPAEAPLAVHLSLLCGALLLPVLLLTAGLTFAYAEARRDALRDLALQHAGSIQRALEQEISSRAMLLQMLAATPLLQDLGSTELQAAAMRAGVLLQGQITVREAEETLVAGWSELNLDSREELAARRLLAPVLSDLMAPEDSPGGYVLRLTVPVVHDGSLSQVLSLTMSPQVVQRQLAEAGLPKGWVAVVVDSNRRVIARSAASEQLIGRRISEAAQRATAAPAGWWTTRSLTGEEVTLAHVQAAGLGWRVGVMVPTRIAEAPLRRSLAGFGIGAAAMATLALGLAYLFARRIARPVHKAAWAARQLAQGERPPPVDTPVRELSEVGTALTEAAPSLEARGRDLVASEARLTRAVGAARMATWEWDCATDTLSGSAGHEALYNVAPGSIASFAGAMQAILPEDRATVRAAAEAAFDPAGSGRYEAQFRVLDPAGGERWLQSQGAVVQRRPDGHPLRVSGVVMDVTQAQHAAERERRLTREVDHRARNILTVVQSVLRMSRGDDTEAFLDSVKGRVDVLARAHTLLSRNRWNGADLHELVKDALVPQSIAASVMLNGPPIALAMTAVQPLAQVLHEVVVNARRHGALSVPGGQASLRWQREGGELVLHWQESGGPPVQGAPRPGFGLRVLENTTRWQLAGTVEMHWERGGLACDLRLPERTMRHRDICPPPPVPAWPLQPPPKAGPPPLPERGQRP